MNYTYAILCSKAVIGGGQLNHRNNIYICAKDKAEAFGINVSQSCQEIDDQLQPLPDIPQSY